MGERSGMPTCSHGGRVQARQRSFRRAGETTAALPAAEAIFPRGTTGILSETLGKICSLQRQYSQFAFSLPLRAKLMKPKYLLFRLAELSMLFKYEIFFVAELCSAPYSAKAVSSDRSTGEAPICVRSII